MDRFIYALIIIPITFCLSGCLTITGPQAVPDYSIYEYRASDCRGNPVWSLQSGSIGAISAGQNSTTVSVTWGEGPSLEEVKVECTDAQQNVRTATHEVEVVKLTIDQSRIVHGTVEDGGTEANGPQAPYKRAVTQGPNAAQPNGVDYRATVTLEPYIGGAENRLAVGFVQILREIPTWESTYRGIPINLEAKYEAPRTGDTASPPPWRDVIPGSSFGKFYHSADQAMLRPLDHHVLTKEIVSGDSPATFWPLKNENQADLDTADARYVYDTYICVITTEAPDIYTIRGQLRWSVDFRVRPVDQVPMVSGTINIPNPAVFTSVTSGARPTPLDGLLANEGGNPPRVMFREP